MQPLFSVIIPCYNRAHILGRAIDSVIAQVYANWELVIVDDGSSDNTQSIVESYNDQRIVYIKKENGGVCSARNLGVHSAKGEYIVFLDSDDAASLNWLLHFYQTISVISTPDMICGGIERKDIVTGESLFVKPTDRGNGAISWAVIIPGAFAVKKDFFIACGLYDEKVTYAENTELFIRLQKNNPKVEYTNNIDLIYYCSSDGGSKNVKNIFTSCLYLLKKHPNVFDNSLKNKFIYFNVIVVNGIILKEYKIALHYLIKAFKMKPLYLKNYYRMIKLIYSYSTTKVTDFFKTKN